MNGCCEVARGQSKLKHGRGRRWAVLPEHLRLQMLRMWRDGHDTWEIAHAIQVSRTTVYKVLEPLGGVVRPELVEVSDARLSLDDRVEIRLALEEEGYDVNIAALRERYPDLVYAAEFLAEEIAIIPRRRRSFLRMILIISPPGWCAGCAAGKSTVKFGAPFA